MDLYQQNVLEHYKHPKCNGQLAKYTHYNKNELVSCGDDIEVYILAEGDKIKDISWQGHGCVLSQAMASIVCDELKGKKLEDIKKITPDYVTLKLGTKPGANRFHCAWLCIDCLNKIKPV